MGINGSVEKPVYKKFKQDTNTATAMFGISVDEGWRSWILCTDMYEKVADQLVKILEASNKKWN